MKYYVNKGSSRTPKINFDLASGILNIKGRSLPENPNEFYKPLNTAIDEYSLIDKPETVVNIYFDYLNTNSCRSIFDIFKKLEILYKKGNSVTINWNFEFGDDDMKEHGQDFQSVLQIPFKMVEVGT